MVLYVLLLLEKEIQQSYLFFYYPQGHEFLVDNRDCAKGLLDDLRLLVTAPRLDNTAGIVPRSASISVSRLSWSQTSFISSSRFGLFC